jgi:RNA polymerase sigma-70 factor (ECF subfamily)
MLHHVDVMSLPRRMTCGGIRFMAEPIAVQDFLDQPTPARYSAVVAEYQAMVRKMIYRIVLDETEAEDLAQEAFLHAYRDIHRFRRKARFSTWLCRIAHNLACSHLRRHRPIPMAPEDLPETPAAPFWHPAADLHCREVHEHLHRALAALPEKLRAAILLVCVDETPIHEATYILGCPAPTVYWRIHKARKLLKNHLAPFLMDTPGADHE